MKLTVVGCSGSFPGPDSAASCYLVQAHDSSGRQWSVLVELGSGAFGPLQRYIDPRELDAVLLTHLHPDHSADITAADVYLRFHPEGYSGTVPLYVPGETWCIAEPHLGGFASGDPVGPAYTVHFWRERLPVTVGPFTILPVLMNHPVPTYGLRISGPATQNSSGVATVAYSADTDECEALQELASDVDLFLCEAAFLDGRDMQRGMHLTPLRAARSATEAGAHALVLTHIQPWTDTEECRRAAAEHYRGSLDIAAPGAVYRM